MPRSSKQPGDAEHRKVCWQWFNGVLYLPVQDSVEAHFPRDDNYDRESPNIEKTSQYVKILNQNFDTEDIFWYCVIILRRSVIITTSNYFYKTAETDFNP